MNIDVTSVCPDGSELSRIPAAVYVITQEAIQRSGATVIPDLLGLAPGVQVAQVDANRWALACVDSTAIFSNKVLVLVDGRIVYTLSFSGVYWDRCLKFRSTRLIESSNDLEHLEAVLRRKIEVSRQ